MSSTAPTPVYSTADKLTLTYDQTIAAMGALRRIPGSRFNDAGPLWGLTNPLWQRLLKHAYETAPSPDQASIDIQKVMRKRPRKEDLSLFWGCLPEGTR